MVDVIPLRRTGGVVSQVNQLLFGISHEGDEGIKYSRLALKVGGCCFFNPLKVFIVNREKLDLNFSCSFICN